jgi:CHAD domain-containing protein
MPFRFKKSETPEKAVRRVGGERVEAALDWLEKAQRPAAIHNVRKEIKKLRALLRLVRGEIGGDYRRSMKPLRCAAGELAASRDARVIFRALENLAEDSDARFPQLHKMLQKNWRRETRQLFKGDLLPEVRRLLRKTGRRLRSLILKTPGWRAVAPGVGLGYARGKETFNLAVRKPSPENFHAWRKQVKTFWYQLQLISPKRSSEAQPFVDRLERLGEQLGVEHDLVLLKQFVAGRRGAAADEIVEVEKLIETRRARLRMAVIKSGGRIFAGDPASICQRLEKCWREWRGE